MSVTSIYYSPETSSTAYKDEITTALAALRTLSTNIIDVKHRRWVVLLCQTIDIIVPLIAFNFTNRPEQSDLALVEKLSRASQNLFGYLATQFTYQPDQYLYAMISRNCGIIYNSIHNSRIKIAYHTTEYLIDPNAYISRLMVESNTAVLADRVALDALMIDGGTDHVFQSLLSGVSIRSSSTL